MVKKDAASLIQAGIHPRVVLNKYFPADQESAHCKPVTSSDLYRIANNLNLHDDRGEGTPVYQCLVETENQAVFSSALRILNDIAPEACASVKTLLSDTSHGNFNESTKKAWTYFETNYGIDGRQAPIRAWARFATLGAPPHNLHIERYHRTIKTILKPNFSIIRFCFGLQEIARFFERKHLLVKDNIRSIGNSKSQTDYNSCHPESLNDYVVVKFEQSFKVTKRLDGGETKTYVLE
eukprot:TCALIF_11216-PA protein Name:"Protein of unknown function" AED:0.45 eAED:0.45 QI:0/0/0/0.33/1/0.66/3/0/236